MSIYARAAAAALATRQTFENPSNLAGDIIEGKYSLKMNTDTC